MPIQNTPEMDNNTLTVRHSENAVEPDYFWQNPEPIALDENPNWNNLMPAAYRDAIDNRLQPADNFRFNTARWNRGPRVYWNNTTTQVPDPTAVIERVREGDWTVHGTIQRDPVQEILMQERFNQAMERLFQLNRDQDMVAIMNGPTYEEVDRILENNGIIGDNPEAGDE